MSHPSDHARVGCSGWIYRHWRGLFYPEKLPVKRWFAHYADSLDTVEINNSFNRLSSPETFQGWREQAPPGFCYAVKANRFLTQDKKLKDRGTARPNDGCAGASGSPSLGLFQQ